jgi:hypothetical protein
MRIALCTTTIHIPYALKLMRKCSEDVRFFVAIDEKTPDEAVDFLNEQEDTQVCNAGERWKCAKVIGWNTLARRNLAFLEALKWGADIIYSWDNDNIPITIDHFNRIEDIFVESFNGIKVLCVSRNRPFPPQMRTWYDPGNLIIPATRHRGYPFNSFWKKGMYDFAVDAKLGVAAGLVLGNPDVDATTRMELEPNIQQVNELGRAGVVIDPREGWTVFNSQNTAVIRELIPAWFMMPRVGRHDDIYASLVVQRVARERKLHTHFGQPFTYQQRNQHSLVADLRQELDGMENVDKMARLLDSIDIEGKRVIDDVMVIYEALEHVDWLPDNAIYAAYKWLEDCEGLGL